MNEATCPRGHKITVMGTNSDGRNFSCGFCLAEKKPHVHPLPPELIPKVHETQVDASAALGLYGGAVAPSEGASTGITAQPAFGTETLPLTISDAEPVKRGPGRPRSIPLASPAT